MCYIIFYQSVFRKIKFQIQFDNVKQSMPFFIPLAVGTIRVKVDAYYGTYFFNLNTLSKYQVFLSFLTLAQMASSFALNPFLKNLYRSKNTLIRKLQGKLFWYGWGFALVMIVIMYTSITLLYELHFTKMQYILAFIIMIPLFLHVLLVNEYYKKNKQNEIAIIASILVLFQIILGYYLIKFWDMDGALILKVIGQWSIVIILWLWIRRKSIKTV
jgi:O-antigen/teichoic acid export membrane protein